MEQRANDIETSIVRAVKQTIASAATRQCAGLDDDPPSRRRIEDGRSSDRA